jgi:hypothetical protein
MVAKDTDSNRQAEIVQLLTSIFESVKNEMRGKPLLKPADDAIAEYYKIKSALDWRLPDNPASPYS